MRVAVAQPSPGIAAHVRAVREADARLVVFPELSLTGYELDAPEVALDSLGALVDACAAAGCVALAGAPVDGSIATLRVSGDGVTVAYRKCFLGEAEAVRFAPGPGPVVLDVDGWRVGVGICKDTGVDAHVRATAALGVDLYVAGLVHGVDERDELGVRAERIARACGAYVAFASFAGPTGGGYAATAGHSAIYAPSGRVLAQAGDAAGSIVRAVLD
ncbi:MAG TPA: carbon-nitrogen hydrolase family protein [Solirubrobacter sp.]|nr:carbon-nitrogen hydrolase family protein [Solirubrobacter sp.]